MRIYIYIYICIYGRIRTINRCAHTVMMCAVAQMHEGAEVGHDSVKHILRTDIMYTRKVGG